MAEENQVGDNSNTTGEESNSLLDGLGVETPEPEQVDKSTGEETGDEKTDSVGKPEGETEGNEETPTPPAEEEITDEQASYAPVGYEPIDKVGTVLAESGLNANQYLDELQAQVTPEGGEVLLSEESHQELVEKFGEGVANVMEENLVSAYNQRLSDTVKLRDSVYQEFGGEDKFIAVATAVKDSGKISETDMQELGKMLAKGGIQKETAIQKIKEVYKMTDQFSQDGSFQEGGDEKQGVGLEPISRAEYTKQKLEAHRARDFAKVEQLNKRAKFTLENRQEVWR